MLRTSPVTATTNFLAPDFLNKCGRAVPASTHALGRTRCAKALNRHSLKSFDRLVGTDELRGRHGEAERLGSLHVDHEFEFGRLLYREIGGLGAFKKLIDVAACTAVHIGYIGAVDDLPYGLAYSYEEAVSFLREVGALR